MLRSLDIRDMLIIDRLSLDLGPGLNVLTGETGAGKSILLDSMGFVLGWRGRAALVRQGAERGEVTAVFDLPDGHAACAILQEAGVAADEGELVLRRVNYTDGRKSAWVNGTRVSGEVLRALSETLLELHGQHDDRGLLDTSGHRDLLDAFAGADTRPVHSAWAELAAARKALSRAEAEIETNRAEEDYLRHAVSELDALSPDVGEDARLDAKRRLMQGAEKIREDVARALQALGTDGAEGRMLDASRWLDGAAEDVEGRLDDALAALERAMAELGEAQAGVESTLDALAFDPHELEATEERLFAIRGLARKHGIAPDDLPALAADLRQKLDLLDASGPGIRALRVAVEQAQAEYDAAASVLTDQRLTAGTRLDAAMAQELAPLKMERATFHTRVAPGTPGPNGTDEIAFEVATNPGAPAGKLDKIASGGELSRFLLALKVCLTGGDRSLTLIFDEIDRGVGGATADAVGRRLARLAKSGQVLVVTHAPQVAAMGDHHFQISKAASDGVTRTDVVLLENEARLDEIARMLAGDRVTDAARAAAQALLDAA